MAMDHNPNKKDDTINDVVTVHQEFRKHHGICHLIAQS
jgi:hypothetical protein